MRPLLKAYLVLAVLLWQAVAWVSPYAVHAQTERLAHQVAHVEDIDHHHHDDESLHLTSDDDSAPHFHADDGFQPLGLTAISALEGFVPQPSAHPVSDFTEPPTVFLDGLLRPPSTTA